MNMALVLGNRCLAPSVFSELHGWETLSVENKRAQLILGRSAWSNLHPLFCTHAQPPAVVFGYNFHQQKRFHTVYRNHTSIVSVLENVMPAVTVQECPNELTSSGWKYFARHVSGEWDGYGAEFTLEGKPIELPERVVPEAFREWEVQVYDWQTQCPTLAEENMIALTYKPTKLLPTVGCEADAATQYSVDERQVGGNDNQVSYFAFHSSGCYVAVWPSRNLKTESSTKCNTIEIEHCLVEGQNSQSRVRIIQQIDLGEINGEQKTRPWLQKVSVYSEQWYGPFRNGEQLGGCAIGVSAFASTSPLDASRIEGIWKAQNLVAEFETESKEIFKGIVDDEFQDLKRDLEELVFLPKNLWCTFKIIGHEHFISEVGWLFDANSAVTSNSKLSKDGKLKKTVLRFEQQCTSSS